MRRPALFRLSRFITVGEPFQGTVDGMADPKTPDPETDSPELAPLITSRFLFVDVAAQRAKQLRRGAVARLTRTGSNKLERVAMDEVRTGLIHYTLPTGYDTVTKGPVKE